MDIDTDATTANGSQWDTCPICLMEKPTTLVFRCRSHLSHSVCGECARTIVDRRLREQNLFTGSASNVTCCLGFSCPVCRDYITDNPFKMLPPSSYPKTQSPVGECSRCHALFQSAEDEVKHAVYLCPKNTVTCNLCSLKIPWGNLRSGDFLRDHVFSGQCSGVICGGHDKTERCGFRGTHKDAMECFRSHKVRQHLINKFKQEIREAPTRRLANVADMEFCDILLKDPSTEQANRLDMLLGTPAVQLLGVAPEYDVPDEADEAFSDDTDDEDDDSDEDDD
jgi:hypothetical protein